MLEGPTQLSSTGQHPHVPAANGSQLSFSTELLWTKRRHSLEDEPPSLPKGNNMSTHLYIVLPSPLVKKSSIHVYNGILKNRHWEMCSLSLLPLLTPIEQYQPLRFFIKSQTLN